MLLRNISSAFTAGVIGSLAAAFGFWLLDQMGFTSNVLNIHMVHRFNATWLYPQVVLGGLWGLLFMTPVLKDKQILRGILFSLGPTMMVFFKYVPGLERSLFGYSLSSVRPELVLIVNFAWGVAAAVWYRESSR